MATSMEAEGPPDEVVYRTIRGLIVSGKLFPGSWVVERELASRLGVSRTPVRAALHRLLLDGLVQNSGSDRRMRLTVTPLTRKDAQEVYLMVGALEGLVAWHAASFPEERRLALATTMREINRRLEEGGMTGSADPGTLMELHQDFHLVYLSPEETPRLAAAIQVVRPQAERYRRIYSHGRKEALAASIAEHDRIVDSLESGDPDGCQQAVQTHWREAAQRLSRMIEEMGEHGQW